MIKKTFILIVVLLTQITFAQKAQKFGYIDRAYILENVPEYKTAQANLDTRIKTWNGKLDKLKSEIEAMKLTLSNEKALLTADLIAEREEDIEIQQIELKRLQEAYYGTSGDLFMLRKQLVKPIQDQIFNAIQEIVKTKKYDVIFDKSSDDMVMLYSNPKFDISELVLKKIVKGRKVKATAKKKTEKELAREKKKEALKVKKNERLTKQEQMRERIRIQNEAKAAKREAIKKVNKEKREKRKAEIEAKRLARTNKVKGITLKKEGKTNSENKIDGKAKDVKEAVAVEVPKVKTKAEIKAEKRQKLVDRANAKKVKRDSLRKVAAEKRADKIAEIEARKKKLEDSKKINKTIK